MSEERGLRATTEVNPFQGRARFVFAGVDHPKLLTESVVLAWCGQGRANNTVRNTLSRAGTFLRWWCLRQGEVDGALVEALMSRGAAARFRH
jgi:hypothetical protein